MAFLIAIWLIGTLLDCAMGRNKDQNFCPTHNIMTHIALSIENNINIQPSTARLSQFQNEESQN